MLVFNAPPIVWTALVTPLTSSGEIDFDALAKLTDRQVNAGNGILYLGSTGESLNLTNQEKKQILDWVRDNRPDTPIMCGIGGIGLETTSAWVRALNEYPFDAYLMVTPPYAKPGDEGQRLWFQALMDVADKPCMLYNVPGRTACALSKKALAALKDHKRFWAVKESSGSVKDFQAYKEVLPNSDVYCGDDLMMPEFSKHQACGLVSVASNAWPEQVHNYAKQCMDQTFDAFELWEEACDQLFVASNPVPIKHLLHQRGLIASPKVKLPLSESDMKDPSRLMGLDRRVVLWV